LEYYKNGGILQYVLRNMIWLYGWRYINNWYKNKKW
jgi:hypothetical protein